MLFDVNWCSQHSWSSHRRQSLLHTESEFLLGFRNRSNTERACFHPHPSKLADFHCILKFDPPFFFSSQPAFSPLWFVSWIDLVNDLEPFSFKEFPIIKGESERLALTVQMWFLPVSSVMVLSPRYAQSGMQAQSWVILISFDLFKTTVEQGGLNLYN